MSALTDLFRSERGLFALAIVFASTILCAIGRLSVEAWQEMTLYVFGIYATGKTVSSVVAATRTAPPEAPVDHRKASQTTEPPVAPADPAPKKKPRPEPAKRPE